MGRRLSLRSLRALRELFSSPSTFPIVPRSTHQPPNVNIPHSSFLIPNWRAPARLPPLCSLRPLWLIFLFPFSPCLLWLFSEQISNRQIVSTLFLPPFHYGKRFIFINDLGYPGKVFRNGHQEIDIAEGLGF